MASTTSRVPRPSAGWTIRERRGTPGELLAGSAELFDAVSAGSAGRTVSVCVPTEPALVLGSMQDIALVDGEAASASGVDVVRRRGGGGAVLVAPGDIAWVDVVIAREDRLWSDDVAEAALWIGETWVRALGSVGVSGARVTAAGGGRDGSPPVACFGSTGSGEVTVGGRKVVGVSQRRRRGAALFQCGALVRWRPDVLVDLLVLESKRAPTLRAELSAVACGVVDLGIAVACEELAEALASVLPD